MKNLGNVNGFEISLMEEQIYQTDIPKPLLHMEKDLDFKKHGNTVGFDAPECIIITRLLWTMCGTKFILSGEQMVNVCEFLS